MPVDGLYSSIQMVVVSTPETAQGEKTRARAMPRPMKVVSGSGGGFFWSAPRRPQPPRVFSAGGGEGEAAVHGRPADWVALAAEDWTLIFAGATGDTRSAPWHIGTGDHPGVGSALASPERPLTIAPADTVTRRIVTAVADGCLGRDEAARIAGQLSDKGAAV
ncbi:conserved hypothetical protein [Streptomyces himastatinicus ATCC 53653]|uniref:Uncharacterized protein n=2 Tax=Streptomyces violaceusniger group TaxID=2839105 RepID=D9WC50_9ACTN|nr:conserved hypothetical protein [Streptomyces himastatinicus ATCC 53653]